MCLLPPVKEHALAHVLVEDTAEAVQVNLLRGIVRRAKEAAPVKHVQDEIRSGPPCGL